MSFFWYDTDKFEFFIRSVFELMLHVGRNVSIQALILKKENK